MTPNRIRFTIQQNELWAGWCALQTPAEFVYACTIPGAPGMGLGITDSGQCSMTNTANGEVVITDCDRFWLCMRGVCACSVTSCGLSDVDPIATSFDLALSASVAIGTSDGYGGGNHFHFTKDP
jgi:hypothetical protein